MFQIRDDHLAQLARHVSHDLEERLLAHIVKTNPERVGLRTEADIRQTIRRGVAKAKHYGIRKQRYLASFVQIQFELGEGFDVDPMRPWANRVLVAPTLDEGTKIDYLWAHVDGKRLPDQDPAR